MKITKENIEYFIFDYHEGNLSDSDKAEVLNFIHLHPEYENDFTHWAQSYFHSEDSIKNYGIADTLIQKDVIHWYLNKWFVSSGAITLLAIGVFSYLFLINSQPKTNINESASSIPEKQIEKVGKSTPTRIIVYQNRYVNHNTELPKKQLTTAATASNTITLSNSDTLVLIKNDNDITPVNNNTVQQNAKTVDTLQKHITIQDNNAVQTKKAPSKHKSKLNLKPDTKFIPTNPDF